MVHEEIVIKRENYNAHDAAHIADVSNEYSSEIFLQKPTMKANGKSIMGIISMSLKKGESVIVSANGSDEKEAVKAVISAILR